MEAERYYDHVSAKRFLEREGADRGFTACFVRPNATCPACRASVFYYQNKFGSRVFFDELGPPWPKHPCTSRSAVRHGIPTFVFPPITRRPRGNRIEIADAMRRVGKDPMALFRDNHGTYPSTIYIARATLRLGFMNIVEAEPIILADGEPVFIEFTSKTVQPAVADLIGFDGGKAFVLDDQVEGRSFMARLTTRDRFEALQGAKGV